MLIILVFQYTAPPPFIQEDDILEGSLKVVYRFLIDSHTNIDTLENQGPRLPADEGTDLHGGGPQRPVETFGFQGVSFNNDSGLASMLIMDVAALLSFFKHIGNLWLMKDSMCLKLVWVAGCYELVH